MILPVDDLNADMKFLGRVANGRKCWVPSAVMESVLSSDVLQRIGRPVFICIDLDALTHNMKILASLCSNKEIGMFQSGLLLYVQ